MPFDAKLAPRPAPARMPVLNRRQAGVRRLRPILLAIEAGSTVTTFGHMLVVAHPAHPVEIYDRDTGERLAVGGFEPSDPLAPMPGGPGSAGVRPALELVPIPPREPVEGHDLRRDLRARPA